MKRKPFRPTIQVTLPLWIRGVQQFIVHVPHKIKRNRTILVDSVTITAVRKANQ